MKKICTKEIIDKILVMSIIMVISGIFGFIYEVLFYKIELGYFVKRGTVYGPWIPIYGFGGLFIFITTYKYKDKASLTFLISLLVCGLLEFMTGYLLYHIEGIRLWDYNNEILNFGNIGGYVCLRSVVFFGLSGLFLMRCVLPLITNLKTKLSFKKFSFISAFPCTLFLIDFIVSDIFKLK